MTSRTATARSPSMSGRKPPAVLGSVATQPRQERVEHGVGDEPADVTAGANVLLQVVLAAAGVQS